MTYTEALAAARRIAIKYQRDMYVVVDDLYEGYRAVSESDLDTFYAGQPVMGCYGPDGLFEPGN